jgi:hypothetical protein
MVLGEPDADAKLSGRSCRAMYRRERTDVGLQAFVGSLGARLAVPGGVGRLPIRPHSRELVYAATAGTDLHEVRELVFCGSRAC